MSRQTQNSMLLVGVIAGGIALVAFLVMLVAGGAGFNIALFGAILIGLIAAIVLFRGFHSNAGPARGPGNAPTVTSSTTPAATASAPAAAAPAAAVSEVPQESHTEASHTDTAYAETAHTDDTVSHGGTQSEADMVEHTATDTPPPDTGTADTVGTEPQRLDEAREGGPDDLKKIKGVGPKLEAMLHRLGFYHFDQVANWSHSEVAWVDENLEGFKGRVSRDNWVEQAKVLSEGGETEFSKKVDEGDVY